MIQASTGRALSCWISSFLVVAAIVAENDIAHAYSTRSVITDGCHERLTFAALDAVRRELGPADAIAPNDNERALIDDAPFEIRRGLDDLSAVTLVLGNRSVDLKGNDPDDLDQLAQIHANPANQDEHCLRRPTHDGPEGNAEALAECRAFIRRKVEQALDGLDASGRVDPNRRTEVEIFLDLRGSVDAELPTYHVEMGRALHTIQDGFSHTFRTDDLEQVTAVLNYIEWVEDTLDESVDGPAHSSALDECVGLDAARRRRLDFAAGVSAQFLLATLDPSLSREEKLGRVDALLTRYFSYRTECTADNGWCNAPERDYAVSGCAIGTVPRKSRGGWVLVLLLAAAFRWRTARRSSSERRLLPKPSTLPVTLTLLVTTTLVTTTARAQTELDPARGAQPDEVVVAEPEPGEAVVVEKDADSDALVATEFEAEEPPTSPWGAYVSGSVAVQNTALAASLGGRYRLDEHWIVGADVEYNPWIARSTSEIRPGIAAAYGTVILRFPMRFERVNLRSTLHAGATYMLFDLFGVPDGTVGMYLGGNLLGIDYEFSDTFYLVVDPANIVIPIVKLTGVPFTYPQYRFTVGLQWGA